MGESKVGLGHPFESEERSCWKKNTKRCGSGSLMYIMTIWKVRKGVVFKDDTFAVLRVKKLI